MPQLARLADVFLPEQYQLSITIDRMGRGFSGTVTVRGMLRDDVKYLPLHAKNLKITAAVVDGKKATVRTLKNDELRLSHPDLLPGPHIAVVGFSGQITDTMNGMYPCYYNHNGIKKELIATQFESHYARNVFPCVDEPAAKATFKVTLLTEPDITVLGNTPLKRQKIENGKLVSEFTTTPKMSPYLLAWVVGDLHKKSAITESGVEVNAWATPAQDVRDLEFGLDIATRTIDFFENYFGVPYPLAKSDHIALPDFSSGAMENWGLITYREVAFLANPGNTAISTKHYIATVIAHELAHQWFGNLVTMRWWDDLWLNESFATLMEYLAIDSLEPSWDIWNDFASHEGVSALSRDCMDGVQSVQNDVTHPDEIQTLFDGSIVYAKGARLLSMLMTYVGETAFREGLSKYFQQYAYQNTEAKDLWQTLSESSGKDVEGFMETWLSQPGFPVVHVTKKGGSVRLEQERFFIGPHRLSNQLWQIPLNASSGEVPELFKDRSINVPYTSSVPLRLNVNDNAHFITHYDEGLLKSILEILPSLQPIDRLQLMHEQALLARAGVISSANLIPLLDSFRNESSEAVWSLMLVGINDLKKFVETDSSAEDSLKNFVGDLAYLQYQKLGWHENPDESETETKLRAIIISCMLYSERQEVIDIALGLYNSSNIENLDPELRSLIIGAAVRHGKQLDQITTELLDLHRETHSSELREDIASGLTTTKTPHTIKMLLSILQDKSLIRPQDFIRWLIGLMRNRYSRDLTWKWVKDNWSWIEKTFKHDASYDYFPRYIAGSLVTKKQLDEYLAFFEPMKKDLALKRNIEIGIGEIQGRIDLIERDKAAVRQTLSNL